MAQPEPKPPVTAEPPPPPEQNAGSVAYNPVLLFFYDFLVLFLSSLLAWKCSAAAALHPLYRSALGRRHLDIGVGTGYHPAHALAAQSRWSPSRDPCEHITLVDLNPHTLAASERRIRSAVPRPSPLAIRTLVADAAEPLPLPADDVFDSISLFYILHCMPGPPARKNAVFDALRPRLAPGGVLAGATVLGREARMNWLARRLMTSYNGSGIFDNWDDSEAVFAEGLRRNFDEVEMWRVGRSLLFRARKPRAG